MAFRPYLLAAALLPSIAACGGGGGDDGGTVVPMGDHNHYVAQQVLVPTTTAQADEFGLDIDGMGDKSDNALGMVLSTLKGFGFDVQGAIDEAVAQGDIILLADFQTTKFDNDSNAGIQVFLGDSATATPAPCNTDETYDPTTMTGCGHHLSPSGGMFTISADSPTNAALGGKIVNGQFTGGPGNLSLQIALGGGLIQLDLVGARAKGSGITTDAISSMIFGGAITKDDIDNKIIPAIQMQLVDLIAGDCTELDNPPDCGCTADSTGGKVLSLFDTQDATGADGMDCAVTVEEIKSNNIVNSLLTPDVTVEGVCEDMPCALSLGIKAVAEKATFTVAGQ
jgi:hypothetical protein